jgi:hypothetical protein
MTLVDQVQRGWRPGEVAEASEESGRSMQKQEDL